MIDGASTHYVIPQTLLHNQIIHTQLKFSYHPQPSLPANAWSVKIRKDTGLIHVFHGSGVESTPLFFSEGVWNDRFDHEGMGRCTLFFGTGGMIDASHAVFHTSSDQSAPLYSLQRKDELMISNSIFHLMVIAGTKPRKAYPFYTHDFVCNRRAGIGQPAGTIFHAGKGLLKVHFNTKIRVSRDLSFRYVPYSAIPPFEDFSSLRETFKEQLGRVFKNASDGLRRSHYGTTALCSSGYDSLTNSVICAGLGCDTFLSIVDSKADIPDQDTGKVPLGHLGIKVHEVDRHIHLTKAEACDAEFALTAVSNYPHLSGCEELLRKRLLIGGHFGGLVWDLRFPRLLDDWKDWSLFNLPMIASTEHRLRVGYIDVNPEAMFVRHASIIDRISKSDEMIPFILGSTYERPIPRRIIEEAGIPRGSFATKKRATGYKYFADPDNLHPGARSSYQGFMARSFSTLPIRWYSKTLYNIENIFYKYWFHTHQQQTNDDPDRWRLVVLDARRVKILWSQSFMLQWSFDMLKERYTSSAKTAGKIGI